MCKRRELDLIDKVHFDESIETIRSIFDSVDDDAKLALCRDIAIDRISTNIDGFPLHVQKEILAILADKYLSKWAQ